MRSCQNTRSMLMNYINNKGSLKEQCYIDTHLMRTAVVMMGTGIVSLY